MELKIFNKENSEIGKKKLPMQFSEEIRPDLIKRAVLAIQQNKRQPYGAHLRAGKRHSSKLSRRRKDFKASYGFGISRVPRKIHSGKGSRWNWTATLAPGTVGGRRAHHPKASKIWSVKINKKEKRKAIRSAISATLNKTLVKKRGHLIPDSYPFLIGDDIESIKKTKDVKSLLTKLGFQTELDRSSKKKIRPGKGKRRNRKYKKKKSLLLVVSGKCPLQSSAKNIPGIDIASVKNLNSELLAPGTSPGRATLFSSKSIDVLEKENLFN